MDDELVHYEHPDKGPAGTPYCKDLVGAKTTAKRFEVDCLNCVIKMEKTGIHKRKRDDDECMD